MSSSERPIGRQLSHLVNCYWMQLQLPALVNSTMKRVFLASLYLAILSLLYWLIVIGLYIYTLDLPPTYL